MPYASLFTAHCRGQLAGIEQREVDVDRALRGITQVERAFGSRRHGQREQEVAMRHVARAERRRSPVACCRQPKSGSGSYRVQRIDQRIVLSQVDESRLVRPSLRSVRRTHQAEGEKPDVGRVGCRGDKSRTRRAAGSPWRCRACPPRSSSSSHRRAQRPHVARIRRAAAS